MVAATFRDEFGTQPRAFGSVAHQIRRLSVVRRANVHDMVATGLRPELVIGQKVNAGSWTIH